MQDITIYTAIKNGGSIRGKDTSSFENDDDPSFICFLMGCKLFIAILAISVFPVVPILGIVFSQVYPWQEDGSVCDLGKIETVKNSPGSFGQPVKCTCKENFPMYMLVGGVLYIIFVISWIGYTMCRAENYFNEEHMTKDYVFGFAILVTIACSIVMGLMAESFLSSDRKCGESLSQYGDIMFVFFIIVFVGNFITQLY